LDYINNTMHRLKRDVLGNENIEIKSTDLVNKSTLNHPELNKNIFLQQLVDTCIDYCDCYHAAIVFENTGTNSKPDANSFPKHYRDILFRIEAISRKNRVNDTLVIIDNNKRKVDKSLAFSFSNYMYRTASRDVLQKVISVPIFADSEMTTGLQISDITCGIIRNYYYQNLHETAPSNGESLFHQKLREYMSYIEHRCINYTMPPYGKIYGLWHPKTYEI